MFLVLEDLMEPHPFLYQVELPDICIPGSHQEEPQQPLQDWQRVLRLMFVRLLMLMDVLQANHSQSHNLQF